MNVESTLFSITSTTSTRNRKKNSLAKAYLLLSFFGVVSLDDGLTLSTFNDCEWDVRLLSCRLELVITGGGGGDADAEAGCLAISTKGQCHGFLRMKEVSTRCFKNTGWLLRENIKQKSTLTWTKVPAIWPRVWLFDVRRWDRWHCSPPWPPEPAN